MPIGASGLPDLVLVHGWGMSSAVWASLQPVLARHWRVHPLDLPGHGLAAPAARADLDEWADLCLERAPQRALWLGWSLGAQVALRAATIAPERVRALCLVAATPRFVRAVDWPWAMSGEIFDHFAAALGSDPRETLQRFLALQVHGSGQPRETLRALRAAIAEGPAASAVGLAQGLELLLRNDLRTELAGLDSPSHWLFGERDTLVPQTVAAALAGLLPSARLELISGAGHAPFLSHPSPCLAALNVMHPAQVA